MRTTARSISAPRGNTLSCKGWPQEAALRMLMNNLDREVAENPDELIAPASFRVFDAKSYSAKLDPNLQRGSRGMVGTDPDAIEAWAFDPLSLEALLARLKPAVWR